MQYLLTNKNKVLEGWNVVPLFFLVIYSDDFKYQGYQDDFDLYV